MSDFQDAEIKKGDYVKAVLELNKTTDQNDLSTHIHSDGSGASVVVTKCEGDTLVVGAAGGGAGWSVGGVQTNYGPGGAGTPTGFGSTGGPTDHEVNRDHTFGPGILDDDRNKD